MIVKSIYVKQQKGRLSFEDDSFKKFTGEIVKKYMQEEEIRAKHQSHLLKLREKALMDKTNAELVWLKQMKKKALDKGEDERMPMLLRKEKGIMQKLREEQECINKMKEMQRKATESRLKILSQHSEVIKWCQHKLNTKSQPSKLQQQQQQQQHMSPTPPAATQNDVLTSDAPLVGAGVQPTPLVAVAGDELALTIIDDDNKNSNNNVEEDDAGGVGGDDEATEADQSHSQSLKEHSQQQQLNHSSLAESKIMRQVKQHLNSEKYLTEREKKLRLRRKHAEEIIAWKKKLDDEEMQIREIERQASQMLLVSKQKQQQLQQQQATPQVVNEQKTDPETKLQADDTEKDDDDDEEAGEEEEEEEEEDDVEMGAEEEQEEEEQEQEQDEEAKQQQENEPDEQDDDAAGTATSVMSTPALSDKTAKTTTSVSTSTCQSELELRLKELKSELTKKRAEAEQLRQALKSKEKNKLRLKEEVLRSKISSYDSLIDKIKCELESNERDVAIEQAAAKHKQQQQQQQQQQPTSKKKEDAKKKKKKKTNEIGEHTTTDEDEATTSAISVESTTTTTTTQSTLTQTQTRPTKRKSGVQRAISKTMDAASSLASSTSMPNLRAAAAAFDHQHPQQQQQQQQSTNSRTAASQLSSSEKSSETPSVKQLEPPSLSIEKVEEDDTTCSLLLNINNNSNTTGEIGKLEQATLTLADDETASAAVAAPIPPSMTSETMAIGAAASVVERLLFNKSIRLMMQIRESKLVKCVPEELDPRAATLVNTGDNGDEANTTTTTNNNGNVNDENDNGDNDEDDQDADDASSTSSSSAAASAAYSADKLSHMCVAVVDEFFAPQQQQQQQQQQQAAASSSVARGERSLRRMLCDLTGELLIDLFVERYAVPESVPGGEFMPCLRRKVRKQHFRSIVRAPLELERVRPLLSLKMNDFLRMSDSEPPTSASFQPQATALLKSKWRAQKRLDLVDSLLDNEMREQEHDWSNYEFEENEAKLLIANSIFDALLRDTLDCVQLCLIKRQNYGL